MASMYHNGGPGRPPAPPPPPFSTQQQKPLPPPPIPPSSFPPAQNPTFPSAVPNQFPPPSHYHPPSYHPPPRPPPNFNQIPQNYASAPSAHFPQQYTYPHLPPPSANPPFIPPPPSVPLPPPPPALSAPQYYPNSQYPQIPPPPSSPPPPPNPPSDPPPPPPPNPSSSSSAIPVQVRPKERMVVRKPGARVETEEERKIRKRKEYEKQKMEEKKRRMMESQATVLHKTNVLSSGGKAHASVMGPRGAERKSGFLPTDRVENRLKKPTTFLCKLKFRNELPDTTAQPKLLTMNTNKDWYTRFSITSLERMHKPKLFHEPDLGIPLDLLDISVYNTPSVRPPLAPEDEDLLRDGDGATPVKLDSGIRRKERPTDKGVSWLVKTQYISPISLDSAKQSITEKQAKELRETREGRNLFLETLNNREKQIQAIEESFKVSKSRPVHQTKPGLEPVEIWPLLPNLDRHEERFVTVAFDNEPTADSEIYSKLGREVRDEVESKAVMKSFVAAGSDSSKPEKFLAYLVPHPEELSKDMFDESEDMAYSWVREYHWDVRGDDVDGPTTYLVHFDEATARYLPLPTKLVLQKKKAKEGRSADDADTHYPVPSRVTVRTTASAFIEDHNYYEYANSGRGISASKRRSSVNGDDEKRGRILHDRDSEHSSGDYISD